MQRFNINWTAKALTNQMEKGKVNYDNAVQRNLVWDVEKKSLLIHSMIYGYAEVVRIHTMGGPAICWASHKLADDKGES